MDAECQFHPKAVTEPAGDMRVCPACGKLVKMEPGTCARTYERHDVTNGALCAGSGVMEGATP